jgi:hypothetical protein
MPGKIIFRNAMEQSRWFSERAQEFELRSADF